MFITIYQHSTVIFHLFDPQKTGWHQQLWILLKLHLLKGWTKNNGQRQRLKPATWIQPGFLWIIRGQTNKLLFGFTHLFPGGCSLEKISCVSSKILYVRSSYLHLGNLRIKCRNIHHIDGYTWCSGKELSQTPQIGWAFWGYHLGAGFPLPYSFW